MKEDIMNSIYTVCLLKDINNTKYLAFSFAIFHFKGKSSSINTLQGKNGGNAKYKMHVLICLCSLFGFIYQ